MKKEVIKFECVNCGMPIYVTDADDNTMVICVNCGVWMRCCGKTVMNLKYKGKAAGDKAIKVG